MLSAIAAMTIAPKTSTIILVVRESNWTLTLNLLLFVFICFHVVDN